MPSKSLQMFAAWSNYNLTVGDPRPPFGSLAMTIENLFSLHCSDVDPAEPMEALSATGSVLLSYVNELEKLLEGKGPVGIPARNFSAATVGRGWSFAPLTGTPVAQLLGAGLSWTGRLDKCEIDDDFKGDSSKLMIAGGGTRLRELVSVAEPMGLSLPTGGSHLGQSLAGGFGTGTHGSRLGTGGLQNMVRAMHIVTGPGEHVWLQPKSSPVLSSKDIGKIALPTGCTEVTSDEDFANALIHLGGMGIVNAVVVELVERERFNVLAIDQKIDEKWLDLISDGDWDGIARGLGFHNDELQFYELTIDPQDPCGDHAAHLAYTLSSSNDLVEPPDRTRPVPADSIANLAAFVKRSQEATPAPFNPGAGFSTLAIDGPLDPVVVGVLRQMLRDSGSSAVFEHYLKEGGFTNFTRPIDPEKDALIKGSWGQIHGDEITGGVPGSLYNASFAIEINHAKDAVDVITKAVAGLAGSFVFTLRFVKDSAGTLAFTRTGEHAVIEIDGFSPLAISLAQQQYIATEAAKGSKPDVHILAAFAQLSTTLERGAIAVRRALESAKIGYTMHWAKLGNLDAAKVASDYSNGEIASWQKTRKKLLNQQGQVLFSNPALEEYGLV